MMKETEHFFCVQVCEGRKTADRLTKQLPQQRFPWQL